jgi:flagellar hook-associated protein 3 FlgL
MRNFALAAVIGIELMDSPISSEVRAAVNEERSNMPARPSPVSTTSAASRCIGKPGHQGQRFALESQIRILKLHLGDIEGVDGVRGLHPNEFFAELRWRRPTRSPPGSSK